MRRFFTIAVIILSLLITIEAPANAIYTGRQVNKDKVKDYYRNPRQQKCALNIYWHESGYNMRADNPTSSAYGIPQMMMSYAPSAKWERNFKSSADVQIRAGDHYMESKYGSPCRAWSYWQTHHVY